MKTFSRRLGEVDKLDHKQIATGLLISSVILVGSTWGLLSLLNFADVFNVNLDVANIVRYTTYMILASILATVVAVVISLLIIRWPRLVSLPLRIHRWRKKGIGEYFLSPEPSDQSFRNVLRRSLYGSILIVGISLTILGIDLMVESGENIIPGGTFLLIASIIVLPITIMEFYFGPWLIKDSGLFHLDDRDRSLSNVGDNLEDILEFFAGIDILFILIELAIKSVASGDPWIPVFVILIPLGPLFSIVLNFTIIFMIFKARATESMIEFLAVNYDVPDSVSSASYIRSRVLDLVERDLMTNIVVPELQVAVPEVETPMESDNSVEESESIIEDDS